MGRKKNGISDAELDRLAQECVDTYNPYIGRSERLECVSGGFLYRYLDNKLYTLEELNKSYFEHARKDIQFGVRDRVAGYYDKFYRYNMADDGAAYDKGVRYAADYLDCEEEMRIIPYNT